MNRYEWIWIIRTWDMVWLSPVSSRTTSTRPLASVLICSWVGSAIELVRHIKNFDPLLLPIELFRLSEVFSKLLLLTRTPFPCFESWTLTAFAFCGLLAISLPLAVLHLEFSLELLLTIAIASTGGRLELDDEPFFFEEDLINLSGTLDFWGGNESIPESTASVELLWLGGSVRRGSYIGSLELFRQGGCGAARFVLYLELPEIVVKYVENSKFS